MRIKTTKRKEESNRSTEKKEEFDWEEGCTCADVR